MSHEKNLYFLMINKNFIKFIFIHIAINKFIFNKLLEMCKFYL